MGMGHSRGSCGTRGALVDYIPGVDCSGGRRRGLSGCRRVRNGYAMGGSVLASADELENLTASCGAPKELQGRMILDLSFVVCRMATATGTQQATPTRTTASGGCDATVRQRYYVTTSTQGARQRARQRITPSTRLPHGDGATR